MLCIVMRTNIGFIFSMKIHIITAHVRSTTGGYVFTGVCLFNLKEVPYPADGGYPIPGLDGGGGVPHPRSGWGYPIPGLDRGYPILGLDGGTPGYPLARTRWDTPWPGLDGVLPPPPGHDWMRYPPDWMGYLLPLPLPPPH